MRIVGMDADRIAKNLKVNRATVYRQINRMIEILSGNNKKGTGLYDILCCWTRQDIGSATGKRLAGRSGYKYPAHSEPAGTGYHVPVKAYQPQPSARPITPMSKHARATGDKGLALYDRIRVAAVKNQIAIDNDLELGDLVQYSKNTELIRMRMENNGRVGSAMFYFIPVYI